MCVWSIPPLYKDEVNYVFHIHEYYLSTTSSITNLNVAVT